MEARCVARVQRQFVPILTRAHAQLFFGTVDRFRENAAIPGVVHKRIILPGMKIICFRVLVYLTFNAGCVTYNAPGGADRLNIAYLLREIVDGHPMEVKLKKSRPHPASSFEAHDSTSIYASAVPIRHATLLL